jgi:predicted TIM-barrel fold metal-dependent hydrolase
LTRSTLLLGLSLIVAVAGVGRLAPGDRAQDGPPTPPADHHMHVRSPAAVEAFRQAQDALDQVVIPEERLVPLDGSDAVTALDSAGVENGVLLSVAYLFATPELELQDEYRKVRAENDFVAEQVRSHPERLVGFCSLDPLADYALREIERCAGIAGITGLKLHFGSSEFGARDAEIFLERVLAAAPDVPVQVAHLAGQGGYDDAQRQALGVFVSAMEDRPDLTENLFFDLAAVPQPPSWPKVTRPCSGASRR